MMNTSLHTIPAIAAMFALAVQPVAAQERSEEYQQGYEDGARDTFCSLFEEFAPMLFWFGPMFIADEPELSMSDLSDIAEECGMDLSADLLSTPEPADPARCERLAALIAPLDAEVDRLLASSTDSSTSLAITQAQSRRRDIEREMGRAGC